MSDEQPLKPANILNIVAVNQGHKPLTMENPVAKALSVNETQALLADGVTILDSRSSADFGAGHIAGAINVQLTSSEFEQRVGWMVEDNAQFVLLADSAEDAQAAIFKLAFLALDSQMLGYIKGGVKSWMKAGLPLHTVPQIDIHTLAQKIRIGALQVVDSRTADEWNEGHIAQAHFMPYTAMVRQLSHPAQLPQLDIPLDADVAIICASGQRSSTAISVMLRYGYTNVYNVTGGMKAWKNAGLPMVDAEGVACAI